MERGKGTIDLRKVQGRETGAPPTSSGVGAPTKSVGAASPPAPVLPESLEWTAFEHEQVDFGASWYLVPGGIMAALFALALWVQNYFFALFVLIAFAAFVLFRNQPPKKISFSINHTGIRAGKTLYQISRIKSFWIFDRLEHPELSLETTQTFSPYVRLPLGDADQARVRELLLILLPEQQHQQFLLDEIMRIIGF